MNYLFFYFIFFFLFCLEDIFCTIRDKSYICTTIYSTFDEGVWLVGQVISVSHSILKGRGWLQKVSFS